MITVDPRTGSKELMQYLTRKGVKVSLADFEMPFGDFMFEGNGPNSQRLLIGVERKTVRDMLGCIRSGRFSGHQLPGMLSMFDRQYLVIEGTYKADEHGILVEYREVTNRWAEVNLGTQRFMYSQIDKFLVSLEEMTGIRVHRTTGKQDTADHIVNMFRLWNDKPYERHTSHTAFVADHVEIKPWSKARRVARQLHNRIGDEGSLAAEKHFGSIIRMVTAVPSEWAELDVNGRRVGVKTAQSIVDEINKDHRR